MRATGTAIYPVKVHPTWVDKYVRLTMGRLWSRILKAMGSEESDEVHDQASVAVGVRG